MSFVGFHFGLDIGRPEPSGSQPRPGPLRVRPPFLFVLRSEPAGRGSPIMAGP
ncbi:hypothetical protein BBKW_1069 [Bifidobacterium catenulatum subsp. kashiwanohense JCM 15439 = DSM 21854]|nr:hypothetical protein BBKW_1069 [Bifidobacterium catenulatum subsp. kashiwanohense JCM 15439 = DSM 21854]